MTEDRLRVTIDYVKGNEEREYSSGTKLQSIVDEYQKYYEYDIVLAFLNGRLQELHKEITEDCKVQFVTTDMKMGYNAYQRSLCMLYVKSVYDVVGHDQLENVRLLFAVGSGYYTQVTGAIECDEALLVKIKQRMQELVAQNIPLEKRSIHTDDSIKLFGKHGMKDKETLFRYRRVSKVNIYKIHNFEDYYYGYMVPSTKYLANFDLYLYKGGIILQMADKKNPHRVLEFDPRPKLFDVQKEAVSWGDKQGIQTVGDLNERITHSKVLDVILVQEALQEKRISEIAAQIAGLQDKKFIMIAGPSSSGKTTFSQRLSVQLRANGRTPHPIAIDNYFVEREKTPRDQYGEYDFESIHAIDIKQLNSDLTALLRGETVELPSFNFITGKREYHGDYLKLQQDDVLVIEGIHGLNEELTKDLPKENKFKIYISALTQLNVDEHNRIPTTDGRLLRRIVRDARGRGATAKKTISMWPSVRRGEEENIFPFQEEADVMFNSALIYEFAVLKQFAEPLLFGVERDCEEYLEAKRLLKFLDYFVGIPSEYVPRNSLLKEFIGGGHYGI